jgi:hypothetical protein
MVMSKVINWLKTHPAFFGPALTSVAIAASLYLLIDPITVLFIAAIALVAGLNNEVVGRSVPGGFSYVDRPPGKYAATTATEVENAVTFQLAAGETKYIKTTVTPGVLVGHVTPTLEFPEQGQSDISRLRYVGP